MAVCIRCKKDVGLVGGLFYNSRTKRCGNCEKEVKQGLDAFRRAFLKFCEDGVIAPEEWQRLERGSQSSKLVWEECLGYVRGDALHHLEQVLAFASADGIVTPEEETEDTMDRVKHKVEERERATGKLPPEAEERKLEKKSLNI